VPTQGPGTDLNHGGDAARDLFSVALTRETSFMNPWIDVAAEADLFEGAGVQVAPQGRDIALFLTETGVFATDNVCTHGHANLCEGFLEGHEIECPFHQGRFDVRTGEVKAAPCTEPLKTWPVKVENGRVWLALD